MIGKSLKEVHKITGNNLLEIVKEVPENKMYLVQAVVSTIYAAVDSYFNKSAKNDDEFIKRRQITFFFYFSWNI